MVKISKLVTTVQKMQDGKLVDYTTTDTLFVSEVRLDFTSGAIYATIKRGTTNPDGSFVENFAELHITVNPDGSFASDGEFTGKAGDIPAAAVMASLSAEFDQFVSSVMGMF